MADESMRPGYRGKCLYKTGKCNNERALKTSGQPHNLCEEHRHRQNEHQRKLDAKNRYARKDKHGGKDSPTNNLSVAAAVAAASQRHRYMPYTNMRVSPGGSKVQEDMHAMLSRGGIVPTPGMGQPMIPFHGMTNEATPGNVSATPGAPGAPGAPGNAAPPLVGSGVPSGSPEILPSGVVLLPNGPQAPQMPYPMAMQDFDGIVVPLPSYLEGHERVEFRSRIYQKVLDFIAEECMRRFGAPQAVLGKNGDASPGVGNDGAQQGIDRRENQENGSGDMDPKHSRGKTNDGNDSERSSEKKSDDEEKDSDDAQPEDADEDAAPRSKRPTRSRVGRKEV